MQNYDRKCYDTRESFFIDEFSVSAGGVLVNEDKREFLVIKRIRNGEYLLPKGTVEKNELIEETAVREVFEETGYKSEITKPANLLAIQIRQHDSTKHKIVYWFYNKLTDNKMYMNTKEAHEDFESEWHAIQECIDIVTFDDDRRIIKAAEWVEKVRHSNGTSCSGIFKDSLTNREIVCKFYEILAKNPKHLRLTLLEGEYNKRYGFFTIDTTNRFIKRVIKSEKSHEFLQFDSVNSNSRNFAYEISIKDDFIELIEYFLLVENVDDLDSNNVNDEWVLIDDVSQVLKKASYEEMIFKSLKKFISKISETK